MTKRGGHDQYARGKLNARAPSGPDTEIPPDAILCPHEVKGVTTPTATPTLDELGSKLADATAAYEAALADATTTKGKGPEEILKASQTLVAAGNARDRAKAAFDRARWDADNGERMEASATMATFLRDNILDIAEVARAKELGVTGFKVTFPAEGGPLVDVFGAKAPGGAKAPKSSGNGTGGPKPRQFMRNRHTGEELKTRDFLRLHGDEKAKEVIATIDANGGKMVTKDGTAVPIGFQPHLQRVYADPAIKADWELVRKFADGHEETV